MVDAGSGALLKVMRKKLASPSKLAVFSMCPLRYLLETERPPVDKLPSGPFPARGMAVHEVIEKHSRDGLANVPSVRDSICSALAAVIQQREAGDLSQFVFERFGIEGLFSKDQIIKSVQFVKRVIRNHGEYLKRYGSGPSHSPARMKSQLGSEKWFEDRSLEVAGKVDLTYRTSDGTVHVVDFKTGRIYGDDGNPKDGYLLQLATYGILLEKALSTNAIILELIGPTEEWTAPLDDRLRNLANERLLELRRIVPLNESVRPQELGRLGECCHSCPYRPSCPMYISCLKVGADYDAASPFDLFGTVREIKTSQDMLTLRVETSRAITCSISGVPTEIYRHIKVGNNIAGYSLGSFEVAGRSSIPGNFFIFRADFPRASAFESLLMVM